MKQQGLPDKAAGACNKICKEKCMGNLRIASWNCRYGLEYGCGKEKKDAVKKLLSNAGILVLQEVTEHDFEGLGYSGERGDWYGDGKDAARRDPLGVAVLCKEGITIKRLYSDPDIFRYVLPYEINGLPDGKPLTLFAVWIKPIDGNYEKPLYDAVRHYRESQKLFSSRSIMIGDFNTYSKKENDDLAALEKALTGLGNCAAGDDKYKPTFFGSYHGPGTDDFCFTTPDLPVSAFEIAPKPEWIDTGLSDHCPIIVDFDL
jgi:endonuclease/exonuclease/phosphatase family metal-dependent hydrolase